MPYRPTICVDLIQHGAPSSYHLSHTRCIPCSGDIAIANCQHVSVSTSFVRIDTWILTAFYVGALNTMSIFCGSVRLHLYKCFQRYVLMAKQQLPVQSRLSGDAIGTMYLMGIPSGPMKLLHEKHKQSNAYMMKMPIESA
ncbi:unnamed protein product [Rhizopus microsporus]|uniref:Uncharacterized protein n=1 Tax=Rhizopus microsporus TaxID=58291 RepID=A0A1X0RMF9_RHIZD|nr:hypothetical protein BCV71DRAFT_268533 [Rhizopus microsporus]